MKYIQQYGSRISNNAQIVYIGKNVTISMCNHVLINDLQCHNYVPNILRYFWLSSGI